MSDFARRLAAAADLAEGALERAIASSGAPPRLEAAMRHAALGGGKRLRPFLVLESAALFGVAAEAALPAATALELVHCYSLVHDDLPSMDDDALRRGRPTVHVAYDEATAILAGDALLTLAFETVAEAGERAAALASGLARAAGAAGMVGGQMLDLAAEGRFGDAPGQDEAAVFDIQGRKTGALFRFACLAGATLGDATEAEAAALDAYAVALGRAFQLADDLIDAEGDVADAGKRVGKDVAAGKATLVGLLGVDGARARLRALAAEAESALGPFGARAASLAALVRFTAERRA
jgi:farnesyl diphosphate synthase